MDSFTITITMSEPLVWVLCAFMSISIPLTCVSIWQSNELLKAKKRLASIEEKKLELTKCA